MPLTRPEIDRWTVQLIEWRLNRDELLDSINITFALIDSIGDASSKSIFKARCLGLSELFTQFNVTHANIRTACVKIEHTEQYKEDVVVLKEFQTAYYGVVAARDNLIQALTPPTTLNAVAAANRPIKLPEIQLPMFAGELKGWQYFYETFLSLIHHNTALSTIDKYHYLLLSTKGAPHSLVSALPLVENNYETAWNSLVERYNDSRVLALHYLDSVINLPPLTEVNYESIHKFYSAAHDNIHALTQSNIVDLSDFILLTLLLKRVNSHTREKFELRLAQSSNKKPTVKDFLEFLREKCQALELSRSHAPSTSKSKAVIFPPKRTLYASESITNCPHCRGAHRLMVCDNFLSLNADRRRDVVKKNRLCFNCFSNSHMLNECGSKFSCRTCNGKHHSLLHNNSPSSVSPSPKPQTSCEVDSPVPNSLSCSSMATVLLGTAVTKIQSRDGSWHSIRLVIDSGSQLSFITSDCAHRLQLDIASKSTPIAGLGTAAICWSQGSVLCELQANSSRTFNTRAVILPQITTDLPNARLPSRFRFEVRDFALADPGFDKPSPVDFLLGAELFPHILRGAEPVALPCGLSALDTHFGWVLLGRFKDRASSSGPLTSLLNVDPLQEELKRFWLVEEPEVTVSSNPDDAEAEDHFTRTHYRNAEGRYVVSLPFKRTLSLNFGQFGKLALSRLRSLESRLDKNPSLRLAYNSFMQDYVDLGHMIRAPQRGSYLIPHHCVYKNLQSLSKIRVVFDASARPFPFSDEVVSLNDVLHTGPKLQHDVSDVILNFRRHQIVFTTDICKMYRQILIAPEDRKFQHILWRDEPTQPVREYELCTVTYGLACAPYLALRVLKQLAVDEQQSFPRASRVLMNDIYVDDVVTGADNLADALSLKKELIQLLGCAGFALKKWTSNSSTFLDTVPIEDRELALSIDSLDSQNVKILGIQFDASSDSFTYHVTPSSQFPTKRSILSTVARIFDPLGWIAPVVFFAKHFMQRIWKADIGWDESLPELLIDAWSSFQTQLPGLSRVRIPRLVVPLNTSSLTIVGFCDASEAGYAAVVYLRAETSPYNVVVSLLKSKTRVAPVRSLSVPRLELCAAVLLARLIKSLLPFVNKLSIKEFVLCSDSTITLSWLKTPPYRLKTFVANRVVEITNNTRASDWYHVDTCANAADCASRGLLPTALLSHHLWWRGPPWLTQHRKLWPLVSMSPDPIPDLPELKPAVSFVATQSTNYWIDWMQRFSSLLKLQYSMCFIKRFINNTREPEKHVGFLSAKELTSALESLVKFTQLFHFADEIELLQAGKSSKRFRKLCPFLDPSGLLRVGGRLNYAHLPYDAKHPLLLPKNAHLTALIVLQYHRRYMHAGTRTLQALLGSRFWIIASRQVIRRCISRCLICEKLRSQPVAPLMGQLPPSRVLPARPFLNVGTDFAGPFYLKESNRRNARTFKAYFCLFVCMATKAIHLEAVTDLSTEAFLATLDRFVARRGLCENIYSDCGTNYVGASRVLGDLQAFWKNANNQREVGTRLAQMTIKWHFNPPAAPHFGGLWEAAVKSVKFHMLRVIGDRRLTYEEFATILARVEAILNSRPLCALSSDVDSLDVLTPGHFLIGAPLLAPPEPDYSQDTPLVKRWQLTRQIAQHVWRRWSNEYLHTLQQRSKWTASAPNLTPGDLVFLITPNTPPLCWPCGRITNVFPGRDGIVRVAEVRTASGTYRRPVAKLVRLPSSD